MTLPETSTSISILCVDDNPLICSAIRRWFDRFEGLRFVGSVDRASDADKAVTELRPDVVLMDVDMPGEDSFGVVSALVRRHPGLRVAMFSGMANPAYITRAIESGASGYICKDESPDVIAKSIRSVASGEFVLTPIADAAVRNS